MMKHLSLAAIALLALSTSALAQSATGVGVGTGISGSNSESGAIANNAGIGNSSATGTGVGVSSSRSASRSGAASVGNQVNISSPANTNANVHTTVSGTQTIKSAPSMVAPGLTAAGLETCLGSASGTVSAVGFGIGGGSTYKDEDCTARLDSRTLFAMGLKAAAVARLCQRPDVWRSMPDVCHQYWPREVPLPYGITYAEPARALPVRALMSVGTEPASGAIEVIDGKTGQTRLCDNYDPVKQKCWKWQGEAQRRYTHPARKMAALTPTTSIVQTKPKATSKKPPLPTVITQGPKPAEAAAPKVEEKKAEDKKD